MSRHLVLLNTPATQWLRHLRLSRYVHSQFWPEDRFKEYCKSLDHDPSLFGTQIYGEILSRLKIFLLKQSYVCKSAFKIPRERCVNSTLLLWGGEYQKAVYYADLVTRYCNGSNSRSLKFIFAAPRCIRKELERQGFRIAAFPSIVLWSCYYVRLLGRFFFATIKQYLAMLGAVAQRKGHSIPTDYSFLLLGISGPGEMSADPHQLSAAEFMKNDPLGFLKKGERAFIQTTWTKECKDWQQGIYSGPDPILFSAIKGSKLKIAVRATFDFLTWGIRGIVSWISGRSWEAELLPAGALIPKVKLWLNYSHPRAIGITLGLAMRQPLWVTYCSVRKTQVWLISYSANQHQLLYSAAPQLAECEPVEKYLICDYFTAWDEEYRLGLLKRGIAQTQVKVTGPIVFARKLQTPNPHEGGPVKIAIFDLVPKELNHNLSERGIGSPYVSLPNLKKFMEDIYQSSMQVFGQEFIISLKSKRPGGPSHDSNYFRFLDEFCRLPGVARVDPFINPYELVAKQDAVISFPFTSASKLATCEKKPGCFYDPLSELFYYPLTVDAPPLLRGPKELVAWLESISVRSA